MKFHFTIVRIIVKKNWSLIKLGLEGSNAPGLTRRNSYALKIRVQPQKNDTYHREDLG